MHAQSVLYLTKAHPDLPIFSNIHYSGYNSRDHHAVPYRYSVRKAVFLSAPVIRKKIIRAPDLHYDMDPAQVKALSPCLTV